MTRSRRQITIVAAIIAALTILLSAGPVWQWFLESTTAERKLARLLPGEMLQERVEEILGPPSKLEQTDGQCVATYYLDLTTNYPGVIGDGTCLMTIHYLRRKGELVLARIGGPHYPE